MERVLLVALVIGILLAGCTKTADGGDDGLLPRTVDSGWGEQISLQKGQTLTLPAQGDCPETRITFEDRSLDTISISTATGGASFGADPHFTRDIMDYGELRIGSVSDDTVSLTPRCTA